MATIAAIAIMRDEALRRLAEAVERISEVAGVEPATLPTFNRDPAYLHADQLRVLADWAERVAGALELQDPDEGLELQPDMAASLKAYLAPTVDALEDLSPLTVAQLKALADERGIDLAGATRKADIIAVLEAHPLGSEDELSPEDEQPEEA